LHDGDVLGTTNGRNLFTRARLQTGDLVTEKEWLTAADPTQMLHFLRGKTSFRKHRLFAVACCRRIWPLLAEPQSRQAVEVAERYADGLADTDELEEVCEAASELENLDNATEAAAGAAVWDDEEAAEFAAYYAAHAADEANPSASPSQGPWGAGGMAERAAQAELIRCIFGNPFRPVTLNPSWLTSAVLGLAETFYQDRAFNLLLILADALEEAGCDHADLLHHCRSKGAHTRGCWVVDLLRAKE
jgi:hypothetical protein